MEVYTRDNIALRWMADKYDIGYDLFEAIMYAREKQADNMAKFMIEKNTNKLPLYVIVGKACRSILRW